MSRRARIIPHSATMAVRFGITCAHTQHAFRLAVQNDAHTRLVISFQHTQRRWRHAGRVVAHAYTARREKDSMNEKNTDRSSSTTARANRPPTRAAPAAWVAEQTFQHLLQRVIQQQNRSPAASARGAGGATATAHRGGGMNGEEAGTWRKRVISRDAANSRHDATWSSVSVRENTCPQQRTTMKPGGPKGIGKPGAVSRSHESASQRANESHPSFSRKTNAASTTAAGFFHAYLRGRNAPFTNTSQPTKFVESHTIQDERTFSSPHAKVAAAPSSYLPSHTTSHPHSWMDEWNVHPGVSSSITRRNASGGEEAERGTRSGVRGGGGIHDPDEHEDAVHHMGTTEPSSESVGKKQQRRHDDCWQAQREGSSHIDHPSSSTRNRKSSASASMSTARDYPRDPFAGDRAMVAHLQGSVRTHMSDMNAERLRRDFLRQYRTVKEVESALTRQLLTLTRHTHSPSSTAGGGESDACCDTSDIAGATKAALEKREEVLFSIDAHLFERVGQLQRSLQALTPAHYAAVATMPLRFSSSSLSPSRARRAPKGPGGKTAKTSAREGETQHRQSPLLCLVQRLTITLAVLQQLPRASNFHLSPTQADVYARQSNGRRAVCEAVRALLTTPQSTFLSSVATPKMAEPSADLFEAAGVAGWGREGTLRVLALFTAVLALPFEDSPEIAPQAHSLSAQAVGGMSRTEGSRTASLVTMRVEEWCVRFFLRALFTEKATAAATASVPASSSVLRMRERVQILRACMAAQDEQVYVHVHERRMTDASSGPPSTAFASKEAAATLKSGATHKHNDSGNGRYPTENATEQCRHRQQQRGGSPSAPKSASFTYFFPPVRASPTATRGVGGRGGKAMSRVPYGVGKEFLLCVIQDLMRAWEAPPRRSSETSGGSNDDENVVRGCGGEQENLRDQKLYRRLGGVVRAHDVAALCAAIVFFDVHTAEALKLLAAAAPLCVEQADVLTGRDVANLLQCYASLNFDGNVVLPRRGSSSSSHSPSSSQPMSEVENIYVVLGTRAGQLGDSLRTEDIATVLRAFDLVADKLDATTLRGALESSLRMRRLHVPTQYDSL